MEGDGRRRSLGRVFERSTCAGQIVACGPSLGGERQRNGFGVGIPKQWSHHVRPPRAEKGRQFGLRIPALLDLGAAQQLSLEGCTERISSMTTAASSDADGEIERLIKLNPDT